MELIAIVALVLVGLLSTLLCIVYIASKKVCEKVVRERNVLQQRLKELVDKTKLERELEFATTDELIKEVTGRVPGFVLLMPTPSNKQNESNMQIHVAGMRAEGAIQAMTQACYIIARQKPDEEEYE